MSETESTDNVVTDPHSPESDKMGTEWQLVDDSTLSQCGSSPRSVSQIESNSELEELLNLAKEEDSKFQSVLSNVNAREQAETTDSPPSGDEATELETVSTQSDEQLPTSMISEPNPLISSTSEVLSLTGSIPSDESVFGVFSSQSEFSPNSSLSNFTASKASFVCLPDQDSDAEANSREAADRVPEELHTNGMAEDALPEREEHEAVVESDVPSEATNDISAMSAHLEEAGEPQRVASIEDTDSSIILAQSDCQRISEAEKGNHSPPQENKDTYKNSGLSSLAPPSRPPSIKPVREDSWSKETAACKPATKATGFTALLSRLWSEIKARLGMAGCLIPKELRSRFMRLAHKQLGGVGSPRAVNMYLAGGVVSLGALLLWSWAKNRSLKSQLLQSQMDLHHHFTTIVNLNEQLSRGMSQPVLQQCGYATYPRLLTPHRSVISLSSSVF